MVEKVLLSGIFSIIFFDRCPVSLAPVLYWIRFRLELFTSLAYSEASRRRMSIYNPRARYMGRQRLAAEGFEEHWVYEHERTLDDARRYPEELEEDDNDIAMQLSVIEERRGDRFLRLPDRERQFPEILGLAAGNGLEDPGAGDAGLARSGIRGGLRGLQSIHVRADLLERRGFGAVPLPKADA